MIGWRKIVRRGGTMHALCVLLAAGACSSLPTGPESRLGSVVVRLTLPTGSTLSQVSYNIAGGALTQPRTGNIDVSSPGATISAAIGSLPAAPSYLLTLTASASDGAACLGSASFDIAAGQGTAVSVTLACKAPLRTGTTIINGVTLNNCPTIDALSTLPLSAAVGSLINVSATVSDIDGNPVVLAWTATAGTLSSPAAASTTYPCVLGTQALTLTADDRHGCQTTSSVQVTCTPLVCAPCDPHASCQNVAGQATCVCGPGYQGNGTTCADIDECATHASNCSAAAVCTNTIGSFSCACNAGYQGNGVSCADIDECAAHTVNCSSLATCTNTPGSFSCACNTGYQGNGVSCADIDECATHTSNCSAQATCANTIGSFSCACNAGFQGNGISCADINECAAHTSNCALAATCTNTVGSFNCACNPGYQGNGVTCIDVDECATGAAHCGLGSCVNTVGAFSCTCPTGYFFDGQTCSDVDECATGANSCGTTNVCENTAGSYFCLPRTILRASVSTTNGDPNGQSMRPVFSSEGRYVAYDSIASNLVAGDTNGKLDVFVLDRRTGVTTRVSVSSAGAEANDSSYAAAISGDGRYVAFHSLATNLVAGDTNGNWDVFVRDLTTGTTTRVSVSSAGAQAVGGASQSPAISADGRLVVFQSAATNLVAGDTNAQQDVFVHDMTSGVTTLVSVSSAGVQANQLCSEQAISADGRYIGFSSFASTLVVGDDNGLTDVFVRDLTTNVTTRVSVSSAGVQANQASFHPVLSQDGRYVAFTSNASNLVANDVAGFRDVFVRDRTSNTTTRESVSTAGAEANNASTLESISGDGRYLSFSSLASNLVPPDTNGFEDIFVRDRSSGTTALVSMSAAGVRTDNTSTQPTISADGHFIGFYSLASNLVANDNNGVQDIFVVANSLKP